MNAICRHLSAALLCILCLSAAAGAASQALDRVIRLQLWAAHMPGLSAVTVDREGIVWQGTYGWARVYQRRPVTADTLFYLASVSKTVVAIAVAQLWEQGLVDLDAGINRYLPFNVQHPLFPDSPLTVRMLLTHTAGVRDNWSVLNRLYVCGRDSPVSLHELVAGYFVPGGRWYAAGANFTAQAPGSAFAYANMGAVLAAYLVEAVTGIDFADWCAAAIFEPLGMRATAWLLADVDRSLLAMPYGWVMGVYLPYGLYAYPDYPDGALKSTAADMARLLLMVMGDGACGECVVLEAATVAELRRVQFPQINPDMGLLWYYKQQGGRRLLGHNGSERGVATDMFYCPESGVGVLLLLNGNWTQRNYAHVMALEDLLLDVAEEAAR